MPVEFEDVAFALKQGEISRPFFTPQGIHIVKAIERKEILPFEKVKDEIMRRQSRRYGMDRGTEALVEKLKKEYQYTEDKTEWMNCCQKGRQIRDCLHLTAGNIQERCLPVLQLPTLRVCNAS